MIHEVQTLLANEDGRSSGLAVSPGSALPPVLDACCGSRMFWFDRADPRAIFIDKRRDGGGDGPSFAPENQAG